METKYVEIKKQFKLAYIENYSNNSKVGIIVIHGLAEHKGRYEDFLHRMYSKHISMFAVDIRGHGESSGRRGDVKDFKDYIKDLDFFVSKIKKEYPGMQIALLGHSLGGLIATGYVEVQKKIDFLILSSPLLVKPQVAKLLNIVPYRLLHFIKLKKQHSESPQMLAYSLNDPLASNYFSLRLLGVVFKEGINLVQKHLEEIDIPILLMGGQMDPLIQTKYFPELLNKFGSTDKQLKLYPNIKHRLLQSDRGDEVMVDIAMWLDKRN